MKRERPEAQKVREDKEGTRWKEEGRTGGMEAGDKVERKEQRNRGHTVTADSKEQRHIEYYDLHTHSHTLRLRLFVQAAVFLRLPSMSDLKHTSAKRVVHYFETNMMAFNLLLHPSSGEGRGEFLITSARLLLL